MRLRWSGDDNGGDERNQDRFRVGDDFTARCGRGCRAAALENINAFGAWALASSFLPGTGNA